MKTDLKHLGIALAFLAPFTINCPVHTQGTAFTCQSRLNSRRNSATLNASATINSLVL
jgi:hypothetical protein